MNRGTRDIDLNEDPYRKQELKNINPPPPPQSNQSSSLASKSFIASQLANASAMGSAPESIFVKEIEINNCRNRYTLTKTATLNEIGEETGATVISRGRYYRDGEDRGPMDERPLYLHITAETEDALNNAIRRVEQVMTQQPSFITAKVPVGIDNPDPGFNIPANIIGQKGANVKYITQHSGGTRVQLKGKGSGYREPNETQESDEPMYLHLSSSNQTNLEKARTLAESLLRKVKQNHEKYLESKKQKEQQSSLSANSQYYQQYYGYLYSQQQNQQQQSQSNYNPPAPGTTPIQFGSTQTSGTVTADQYQQYLNYYNSLGYNTTGATATAAYDVSDQSKKRKLEDEGDEATPTKKQRTDDQTAAYSRGNMTEEEYMNYWQQYYAYYQQQAAAGQDAGQQQQQYTQPM